MRATYRWIGLGVALAIGAHPGVGAELRDPHFGEALFHAHQGRYFEALQRLDGELAQYRRVDEPGLDTLHAHIGDAEFSVGDFELRYRMHHRAGRAIRAVLEGAVDERVRNEAAYRLASIHFQKDQLDDALHALGRIEGEIPESIRDDIEFLRANVHLAMGRPSEAVVVLESVGVEPDLAGFVAYNLGIALLQDGRELDAVEQLDRAGRMIAPADDDRASHAIRDKANLVLGGLLFDAGEFSRASATLDRVRLDGPFSNQALLRSGWAESTARRHDRSLVPWNVLAGREPTDIAVQEALLAAPHAYANLDLHGRAAMLYGRALAVFDEQIDRVDASIASVRGGKFLEALVREESRHDATWVIRLRELPEAPDTYYLMELMASHEFQTALQNYLDLRDLEGKLGSWRSGLVAFADVIEIRGTHYEPLLPGIDGEFRELDARMLLRLEQKKHVADRLRALLTAPQPTQLATAEERIAGDRLAEIDVRLGDGDDPARVELRHRVARLRGALTWRLETEYHDRLTTAHEELAELTADIDEMTAHYESFVRTRQAATHSYIGYDVPIERLRERVRAALERVEMLMARQGHLIETVAIEQLNARRERLVAQRTRAHYAVADSYDRASRSRDDAPELR